MAGAEAPLKKGGAEFALLDAMTGYDFGAVRVANSEFYEEL